MDKISLKEMKLYGYTGCLPEEKKNGQYFYVSIDMMFRELKGAVTDELSDTVNYAEVYSIAESIVKDSSFDLIEHLAYEIDDQRDGVYLKILYTAESEFPKEIERVLNITDGVLRFLTVRVGE